MAKPDTSDKRSPQDGDALQGLRKSLAGRPTKLTPEVFTKLEEAWAFDATDQEAASYAGIAYQTLSKWLSQNPELSERKAELKELPFLAARKTIVENLDRDAKHAMDYMQRKKKKEFALRTEFSGPDGEEIPVRFVNTVPRGKKGTSGDTDDQAQS